jgi:hypothetical protein
MSYFECRHKERYYLFGKTDLRNILQDIKHDATDEIPIHHIPIVSPETNVSEHSSRP